MDKLEIKRLFYTTNTVFYTSGNRFVRRTSTFGNLIFSFVPSDNRKTRSTCPTSVFTGIGQTLMSRPATSLSERKLILVTTDFFHYISVETVHVQSFFKVRKSSSVALESTLINFIFFRTYYLFNQFIKNRQENFCNRKCYIPTAKDDNSNYER